MPAKQHSSPRTSADRLLLAGVLLAAVSPFVWFGTPLQGFYDTTRFVVLMLAAGVSAIAVAFALRDGSDLHARAWSYALAAFSAVVVVSALVSSSRWTLLTFGAENGLMGAPSWVALAGLAFVVSRPSARGTYRPLTVVLVAGSSLAVAVGAWELARYGGVSGTFGNGNYLGTAVVSCIPLALLLAHASRSRARRVLAWVAMAVLAGGVVLAGSMTAYVVLFGQAIAVLWLAPHLVTPRERLARGLRVGAAAAAGLAAAVLLAWLLAPTALPPSLARTLDEQVTGPTFRSRVALWAVAAESLGDAPLLGHGPDGLDVASQALLSERYVRSTGVTDGIRSLVRDPHLLPLLVIVSFGMVGFGAALAVALLWLRAVALGLRSAEGARRDALLLTALATVSFFACLLLIPWTVRFAALPALLAGMTMGMVAGRGATTNARADAGTGGPSPLGRAAAMAALACGAVVAFWLASAALVGQTALSRAEAAAEPEAALAAARLASAAQPTRPAAAAGLTQTTGGLLLGGLTAPEQLIETYRAQPPLAARIAPYEAAVARVALDHAILAGATSDFVAWAAARADNALGLAPGLPEPQVEAAHAAVLLGDGVRAERLLDSAEALGYPEPRLALYRYYAAMLRGQATVAARHAARVRAIAPDLVPLLRWPQESQ